MAMVASGFTGRYLYTSVPRSASGVELDEKDLDSHIRETEIRVRYWIETNPDAARALPVSVIALPPVPYRVWPLIFGRLLSAGGHHWRWWRARRQLKGVGRSQVAEFGRLLARRRGLHYQVLALVLTRRLISLWHSVHVPLGVALFVLALAHVGAALYYATPAR